MMSAVETLALAYRETAAERYAAHAAKLLRVWFLDAATKMNPNLDYAESEDQGMKHWFAQYLAYVVRRSGSQRATGDAGLNG